MSATMTVTATATATPSTARPGAVRLTRRGRALVLLTLVGLLLTAFVVGRAGSSQAATETTTARPYAQTTVHAGETLWAVAKRVAPGQDPRAVVQQLRELNHLASGGIQAGQQLLLPHAA
ncbi:MAG: hypothetical protein JWN87_1882 [Frankiales bacterium]|jgi:hypothetical protein|nr:hypothetical protein [Frankiales bacterium]MCW2586590.1 hypothetical protein [Frankiales bacterium]